MKNSGLWLAARSTKTLTVSSKSKIKREGHSRFRLTVKCRMIIPAFLSIRIPVEPHMAVFHQNVILPFCFILQIPRPRSIPSLIRKMTPVSIADTGTASRVRSRCNPLPLPASAIVNKAENPGLNFIGKYRLTGFTEERISPVLTLTTRRFTATDRAGIACRHRSQNILPQHRRFNVAFITDNRTFNHDICRRKDCSGIRLLMATVPFSCAAQ